MRKINPHKIIMTILGLVLITLVQSQWVSSQGETHNPFLLYSILNLAVSYYYGIGYALMSLAGGLIIGTRFMLRDPTLILAGTVIEAKSMFIFALAGNYLVQNSLTISLVAVLQKKNRLQQNELKINEQLLHTMSHEIRGPLTANLVMAEIALRHEVTDPIKQRKFWESARRNNLLIKHVLEDRFTASNLGRFSLQKESLDFTSIVNLSLPNLYALSGDKDLLINFNPPLEPLIVEGDPKRLQQIVDNLFSNAIKYNRQSGTIALELERIGTNLEFRVRDTGIGISPEFLPKVFEPNSRAPEVKNLVSGQGLGLAIVKELVERHDGKISVESEQGIGTTFTIILPLVVESIVAYN